MNQKIGICGAAVTLAATLAFAVSMLLSANSGSYFSSLFIAFGFVTMTASFTTLCPPERKAAGNAALIFAGVYAAINLCVYFIQLTTVRLQPLDAQSAALFDFQQFGLIFNLDLLGYALMSLSTLFSGLAILPESKIGRWLKGLLLLHGIFFLPCLLVPMLGIFRTDMPGGNLTGTALLLFWCAYFSPTSLLAFFYLKQKRKTRDM